MSESATSVTRILLIDDHSLFREAIARLLGGESDFEITGECGTLEEGMQVLRSKAVDLVLLDIDLGLQHGGKLLNMARAEGVQAKILVVTAGVSKVEATRLMEKGCAGIFLKQEPPQLLIQRIRDVMSGAAHQTGVPDVAESEVSKLPDREAMRTFTARERQVLRGAFAGHTNKEIAFNLGVSEPLVKAVMQQLFSKTGVRSRSQLVRVAIERHWKEIEEEADE